jgi:hypothetical protein
MQSDLFLSETLMLHRHFIKYEISESESDDDDGGRRRKSII